jgi:hypothetical protein
MDDGSMRTIRQTTQPQVGTHVTIENNTLHTASGHGSTSTSTSNTAPSGNGSSSFSPSGS